MKPKTILKIAVDLAMTILLLLLMAYSLIGESLHEWLGMGMFLLFVLHHVLNLGWYRNLRKGRYSAYRIVQTILAALLLLTMLGSMVSGIIMSRHTFPLFPIRGWSSLARTIHLPCAYWGFLLMSLHLGLHWGMMMGMTQRMMKTVPSPVRTVILRFLAILIALYGLTAFVRNNICSYLLFRTHFVFLDFERPLALFFVDYLSIMGLFVFIAYYMGRLLQKSRRPTKKDEVSEG